VGSHRVGQPVDHRLAARGVVKRCQPCASPGGKGRKRLGFLKKAVRLGTDDLTVGAHRSVGVVIVIDK